ncbi:MAG: GDSL-type esterase/lipase family protein [Lachnospiraceae bacterium]|nr:GDSL-type esterase/lipase family protein [Lachnospiraceae bacterium]
MDNMTRLKNLMKRAANGESLVIGFLGGSITQGSLSSTPKTCYAYLVYEWWKKSFPNAAFSFVNGGIGGTTSHYGGARAWKDVLCYRPDIVTVDFSVNDDANEFFEETYEGTLRRLLAAPSAPAVVVLNNVFYDTGKNAQDYHNRIADHYGIPHVSIKDTIFPDVESGKIVRADITPDNLHPNDKGHRLVADEICKLLDSIKEELEKEDTEGKIIETNDLASLPAPLTENAYEHSRLIQIQDNEAILDGFLVDPIEKKGMLDIFKNGWTAAHTNDKISFEIECSCLAVQYRKSVQQPVPKAKAVIDGDEAHAVILDGNFTEDWGDCLYLEPLLHHAEKKVHRIEITVTDAKDIVRPFYLVSLIVS